jgi:hypothetical protein
MGDSYLTDTFAVLKPSRVPYELPTVKLDPDRAVRILGTLQTLAFRYSTGQDDLAADVAYFAERVAEALRR